MTRTIDIQDTFDEDGEVEDSSDGGHTTDDGGCTVRNMILDLNTFS